MRKTISRFILKIIGKKELVNFLGINELLPYNSINELTKKNAIIGKDSKFYKGSKILNYGIDRSLVNIGQNTHIRGELLVYRYGGSIEIGNNSFVGEGTKIWSGDKIKIGNNVLISHNVNIVDTNSHELDAIERTERFKELLKDGHWEKKGSIITKPIHIMDYAWISFGVTILKGVTIGKGAIVAAGSLVTKDVDDWTVVAGNPTKFKKNIKPIEN